MLNTYQKAHTILRIGNSFYRKNLQFSKQEKPNIERVFQYLFPDLATRRTNKAIMTLCPLHGENNPSFAMYPETNTFYCFSCKKTGDSFKLIMELENISFREAVEFANNNYLYD